MWREWTERRWYSGRPVVATLYADQDRWWFALFTEGGQFIDGRFPEARLSADEAKAAMLESLASDWEVEPKAGWKPSKPGRWNAELQAMEGTPALVRWT